MRESEAGAVVVKLLDSAIQDCTRALDIGDSLITANLFRRLEAMALENLVRSQVDVERADQLQLLIDEEEKIETWEQGAR